MTKTYTYDYASNRTKMVVSGAESYTVNYTYDANNRLTKDTTTGTTETVNTYTYDNNGNQLTKTTGGVTETNTYDVFNRLVGFSKTGTTASYAYKPDGLRLSKTVNGTKTTHIWDGSNIVADLNASRVVVDMYIRGIGLISSEKNGYYLFNGHGDVVQLTNTSGAVTKTYQYDAFGVEVNKVETDNNTFRYCGEYYDKETDTIYLRARYYSPRTGRFTQQDGWEYQKTTDPLSLNLYMYCLGNPMLYFDPTGHFVDFNGIINGVTSFVSGAVDVAVDVAKATADVTVSVVKTAYDFTVGVTHGVMESVSIGLSVYIVDEKTGDAYLVGKIVGDLATGLVSLASTVVGGGLTLMTADAIVLVPVGTDITAACAGVTISSMINAASNIDQIIKGSGNTQWIPSTVLDLSGSSDATEFFKKHEKNFTKLRWNQEKIDTLWQASIEINNQYGIQIDPRLLIAIIIQEGTGSFNTSSTNLAADGQHGVETNYAVDLMKANGLIFGKILGYIYYGEEFRQAASSNNDKSGITGDGNIFQYCNWSTPIIDTNRSIVRTGPYAGHGAWGDSVMKHYTALGGDAYGYENYISSIDRSTVEKIAKDFGIALPSFSFIASQNAQDSKGNPNGNWTIKVK